jgi:hypothetical protein
MKPSSPIPRGYSPSPISIALRPGQVLTVIATDENGAVPEGAVAPSSLPVLQAGRTGDLARRSDTPRKTPDTPRKTPDTPRKTPDRGFR